MPWDPPGGREYFAETCVSPQLSGLTSDPRELCSCLYDLETASCSNFSILPGRGTSWGAGRGGRGAGLSCTQNPGSLRLEGANSRWIRSESQFCRSRLGPVTSLAFSFF